MSQPDFAALSSDTLHAISERHGLGVRTFSKLESSGSVNSFQPPPPPPDQPQQMVPVGNKKR